MPFKSRPGFKREDTDRGAAKADEVDVEVDGAVGGPGSRSASVHVQEAASLDGDGDGDDDRDGVHSPRYAAALLSSAEDPTAKDARFVTSKRELWAFYIYYIGNSGLGPFNFGPSQYQNLLSIAASNAGGGNCGDTDQPACRLHWAGQDRTVESIVLLTNGISFAIQACLFVAIGSLADFGTWRPMILWVFTAVGVATSFSWLGVTDPSQWQAGIALYMVGLIAYQGALTFWTSAFPGLARNLPEMRQSAADLAANPPRTTAEKHATLDSLSRNRISNVSFAVCSAGELVVLAIMQGMLVGIHADRDEQSNTRALSAVIAFSAGIWILCAIPWFLFEKHRPGQRLPPGTSYLTAGVKQAWLAAKYLWRLKQTLLYLAFYFLMGDCLNTSVTVISTVQNQLVSFSTTKLNELLIVGIAAQMVGIYSFWWIQKRLRASTMRMFFFTVLSIILLQAWGFVGIFTDKFGFKNEWEAYAYQAYYGLFTCTWYAYSQTMISEVIPHGYEFLFFALFSVVGKTSAFIGPFVTSAIANDSGNQSMPFAFLLALSIVSSFLLLPLDMKKSRMECAAFLEEEDCAKRRAASSITTTVPAMPKLPTSTHPEPDETQTRADWTQDVNGRAEMDQK